MIKEFGNGGATLVKNFGEEHIGEWNSHVQRAQEVREDIYKAIGVVLRERDSDEEVQSMDGLAKDWGKTQSALLKKVMDHLPKEMIQ